LYASTGPVYVKILDKQMLALVYEMLTVNPSQNDTQQTSRYKVSEL